MTTSPRGRIVRLTSSASCRLQISIIVTVFLIASTSSLPVGKDHKPSLPDKSLLNGAIGELEDALSRLKQYAQSLKSNAGFTNQDEVEDPLAESIERESRDEDYRQEPELVPGLDRFEKNLDEGKEEVRGKNQPVTIRPAVKNDPSDISLQDLVDFLREHAKDKKKEGDINHLVELEEVKTTMKSTLAAGDKSPSNDISVNDLVEFLKERQNQKSKERSDERLPNNSPGSHSKTDEGRTDANDSIKDLSLNAALEYLASLKRKLSDKSQ